MKPIIHVGQYDYENVLFVTLKNVGIGLATVKKLGVFDDNGKRENNLYNCLPKELPNEMNYKEDWTPYSEFVIPAGEIIKLIEIPIDIKKNEQVKNREKLRKMIGRLTVEIIYEDIYENKMPIKTLKLQHFLRADNVN